MEQSVELLIGQSGAHALQTVFVDGQKCFSNTCEAKLLINNFFHFGYRPVF
jgi:hypothetical protein